MSECVRLSDFNFPDLDKIPDDSPMSKSDILSCYASSVKRLIYNSQEFLQETEIRLNSISRD